jgi:hypothetical protein
MSELKEGAVVEWTSQANGGRKKKVGTVVEVVPAKCLPDQTRFRSLYKGYGVGSPRSHESYVVEVPAKGKGQPKIYWPRVSALTPLKPKADWPRVSALTEKN